MFTPKMLKSQQFFLSGKTAADAFESERKLLLIDQELSHSESGLAIAHAISRLEATATVRIDGLAPDAYELLVIESLFAGKNLDYFAHPFSESNFCTKSASVEAFYCLETLRWIQETVTPGHRFTPEFILEVHSRCLYNKPASETGLRFRSCDFDGDKADPRESFAPPGADEVLPYIEDLCEFINTPRFSPLAQTGYMHFQFESIKPFKRSMDRTGRAMCHALLRARNITSGSIPAIALLPAIDTRYHAKSLLPYAQKKAIESDEMPFAINNWIDFCAESISAAWQVKDDYLAIFGKLNAVWREKLGKVSEGSATQRILELLPGYPLLTVETACRLTGKQFSAVNDAFRRLTDAGIVRLVDNVGCTNARLFEARDVIDALSKFEAALISAPPISRDCV